MLFNSFVFVGFFAAVYSAYILLQGRLRLQNRLLLVASYVFYGYWDWRFLSLLLVSTLLDYWVGHRLFATNDPRRRKHLLGVSLVGNLGLLGFFKYFNFFTDSFADLLRAFGMAPDLFTLNIVLPVGISFYTFQTISYSFDIYRRKLRPAGNFLDFALFVSFFPQLVAGPIERAANLLPQVERPRRITADQVNAGIFLLLWGYFQKVVIADNAALLANEIFNDYTSFSGLDLWIGTLAFAIQIYGDFSGYSDIARGLCKLMGFELMVNFKLPYFALNPSDFWSRWHVSLSTWLRDYLYIPLGGNRLGRVRTYANLMMTMLLGGLWHGAAWTFVLWGGFHGLILVLYRRFDRDPEHADPWGGRYAYSRVIAKMALMFVLTMIGWMIFRSETLGQLGYFLARGGPMPSASSLYLGHRLLFFAAPLVAMNLFQYVRIDLLAPTKLPLPVRVPVYAFMLVWIFIFGVRESIEFVYFQF
ncbi:MAG: MBOAT family O-acyltransferase [Gemmatimonadota bacterium]